jgi:hypothetical protein
MPDVRMCMAGAILRVNNCAAAAIGVSPVDTLGNQCGERRSELAS